MIVTVHKRRLVFVIFASLIIWLVIKQYLFCPSFSFSTAVPFAGKFFYNPYDSLHSDRWIKCNFHAHTNAWHGLTHGRGTAKDVYHMYDSMHYAIHCVSDYQSINKTYANTPHFIPAYEHGYNFGKTHQLVLGSNEVKWIDYPFPQSLNNKQDVLNSLTDGDNVVIVNHPQSFHGYNASDFRYLSNYNCMEVLSPYAISVACWDTALSNGKPAFIVGDDDEHNIFSKTSVARMCTWINVNCTEKKEVLGALKKGESYAMILGNCQTQLPQLESLKISGDTLFLNMSQKADQISFIGQNGKLLETLKNTCSTYYVIKPEDTYLRAVIDYPSGTSIFLNPVFRYDKTTKLSSSFHLNGYLTNFKRVIGLLFFVIWARIAFPFVLGRSRRSPVVKPLAFQ
jgi:hypothetical protein